MKKNNKPNGTYKWSNEHMNWINKDGLPLYDYTPLEDTLLKLYKQATEQNETFITEEIDKFFDIEDYSLDNLIKYLNLRQNIISNRKQNLQIK
jgi:hypothetical protein